jgi:hypothetical protein
MDQTVNLRHVEMPANAKINEDILIVMEASEGCYDYAGNDP